MRLALDHSQVAATIQDQRYVGLRAAESLGYLGLDHRSFQAPDLSDLFAGQELLEAGDEAGVDGVLLVQPVIRPFEVSGRAVYLHAVDVVDHRKMGWVRDEGDCDESMDVDRPSSSISEESDLRISDLVGAGPKNFTIAPSRSARPTANPIHAAHATKIADFVEPIKVIDTSPLLVNHQTGPFAKEAHSTVTSDVTQGA